ncbi:MAG TPA: molecular chaperone DnaJ [Candidatus Paceibacterota bacterium]|jgi:molecular chaperone DnaJ
MAKNYYDILGVDRKASKDEVKKAFRKLAQQHHPDKGGSEDTFKEITEAYSVLSDDKKRREYDTYGQSFAGGAGSAGNPFGGFDFSGFQNGGVEFDFSDLFGGGFSDLFGGRSGRQRRGRDISIDIEVSFKESVLGAKRQVLITKVGKCDICSGSGAKPGTDTETCKTCNGAGRVHETRDSVLGAFSSVRTCPGCEGGGKVPKEVCANCSGRGILRKQEEINVAVPAGIDGGEMIRMRGLGEAIRGGVPGDLYVKVHVKPHPVYKKQGLNLVMELPLKLTDALLGTSITVTTIEDKDLEVKVPPMTAPEQTLRIRNKGVNVDGRSGDLLIHLTAAFPKKLSGKAKKLVEELRSESL